MQTVTLQATRTRGTVLHARRACNFERTEHVIRLAAGGNLAMLHLYVSYEIQHALRAPLQTTAMHVTRELKLLAP